MRSNHGCFWFGPCVAFVLLVVIGCQQNQDCPGGSCPVKSEPLKGALTVFDQDGKVFCFVEATDSKLLLVSLAHKTDRRLHPVVPIGHPIGSPGVGPILPAKPLGSSPVDGPPEPKPAL